MAELHVDLPYRAEYSKSNRASCKKCKDKIDKDVLRMAIMVQSPMFDGKTPHWYHFDCFWQRARPKSLAEIAHVANLRYEDQKKIENALGAGGGSTPGPSGEGKKGKKRGAGDEVTNGAANSAMKDYIVEYAKSGGAVCKLCEEKIGKNKLRIGKKVFDDQRAKAYGPYFRNYHADCFINNREELEFTASGVDLPGFDSLTEDDQSDLKKRLKPIKSSKSEDNVDSEGPAAKKSKKEQVKEDKKLKEQSDLLYNLIQNIKTMSKGDLQRLMEANNIDFVDNTTIRIELVADSMLFGAMKRCPECSGQLQFRIAGYICRGQTQWSKCTYDTKKPERVPFRVPDDLKEAYDFLKKYKYKPRERVYNSSLEEETKKLARSPSPTRKKEEGSQGPLDGYKIAVVGHKLRKELKDKIEETKAKLSKTVDRTTLFVIASEKDVKKEKDQMIEDAKANGVLVVSKDVLEGLDQTNVPQKMKDTSLVNWGGDPVRKYATLNIKAKVNEKKEESYGRRMEEKRKVVVKAGHVVQPGSGMEGVAHVLKGPKGAVYDVVLNLVDLLNNKNSYYLIQILESDYGEQYWIYRAWGRTGTTIGSDKLDAKGSKEEAIEEFEKLYEERTGNRWEDRDNFEKKPGKYYPVQVDYSEGKKYEKLSSEKSKSKLDKAIQELICIIFDIDRMKRAMVEMEIDLDKMPLGKLSQKQIKEAYSVLNRLSELIKNGEPRKNIVDVNNQFYSLIPHSFGMDKHPLIDNEDILKNKLLMLETLIELEIAYDITTHLEKEKKIDPIDQHYMKLQSDIRIVSEGHNMYDLICKYAKMTHGKTHQDYTLDIVNIFEVARQGEREAYLSKSKDLSNKMLLWHGSRTTNFAGIIAQGLRIAPKEAPVTGYMFGKGLYFADMVSKSANYCCATKEDNVGLILLCEVALGEMLELFAAKDIKKLPKGKDSVKGVGKTKPNPETHVTLPDGILVPCGEGIDSDVKKSELIYNEYIVYDTNQVNIRYVLRVKFNFKPPTSRRGT